MSGWTRNESLYDKLIIDYNNRTDNRKVFSGRVIA